MAKPLNLEELYVQLHVREEEPPRFGADLEGAADDPERLLRLSQERVRSGVSAAVSPEEALTRYRRFVALGDPGAGKTTMLRHLTFRIAREEAGPGLTLPVYVELRGFVDSGASDLLGYVAAEWWRLYGFADARPYLERELAAGHAVLLLDGLDEVLGGANPEEANAAYRMVSTEVDRLATRYPAAPIVLTCRRAGWRGGLPAFQALEVLDFDWPQIQTFVRHWFTDAPDRGNGLTQSLRANLRMQTLAANPLLLALIAIVYERDLELPERRAALYQRCVEVLLTDWDAHRGIQRFSRFTTDRKRELLEEVGWHFHLAGYRYIPERELLEVIEGFLPTIDLDPSHARAILEEIAAHYGLLKVQAHGWYGFLHLTMQEYFAAIAADRRGARAVAIVARHRHDPWWAEVLQLLADRMSDASPLLLALVGRTADAEEPPEDEPLAADDDLFHGDLIVAARCLVGTPRVRTPWLRKRLMSELRRLLEESPYPTVYRRAAQVLAEIGGERVRDYLMGLLTSRSGAIGRKWAVLQAMGSAPRLRVADRLLTLLTTRWIGSDLLGEVAQTLSSLEYTTAVPKLLTILRRASDDMIANFTWHLGLIPVADALAGLARLDDKPAIWGILDQYVQSLRDKPSTSSTAILGFTLGPLFTAIRRTGDADDIDRLLQIACDLEASHATKADIVREIADALAELGGPEAASRYLELLLDRPGLGEVHVILAEAIRPPASGVVPEVLARLADPGLDWRIGWLLGQILERFPVGQGDVELMRLLDRPDLDDLVKIAISAALACWGNPAGAERLRRAFDETVADEVWSGLGGRLVLTARSKAWAWLARALCRIDDRTVVPDLAARYRRALAEGAMSRDLEAALTVLAPAEAARAILAAKPAVPVAHLGAELAESDIDDAFRALDEPPTDGDAWIIRAIGRVARDETSVRRLWTLTVNGTPDADLALEQVCSRAKVRVFPDGRIEPVG